MIRDERGFTVPELLVTMALLSVLLLAFGQMLITSSKTSNRVEEQAALQGEVRSAIDRLMTDFRQATTASTTAPVEAVSGTAFTFDTPDRSTPYHLRRISYRVVSGQLQRSSTLSLDTDGAPWVWPATPGGWITVVSSITNPLPFVFLDGSGVPTSDPTAVHSMRITLTVAPKLAQGGANTYSSLISIRTLQ
jgi:prepilin-type N-terminal cleavage/methylation domain-containing protein